MLKTLQENLLRQTQQLDAAQQKTGTLNSAQKAELNRIGGVQNKLADLTAELIRAEWFRGSGILGAVLGLLVQVTPGACASGSDWFALQGGMVTIFAWVSER